MKKIPTIYLRDPEDRTHVTDEINPECQWVFDGEGVPTRKFDGTCVMLDSSGKWWARREVKKGKQFPENFNAADYDEVTGKWQGWVPIEDSSFYKHFKPLENTRRKSTTYELIGPKINGNPEKVDQHQLIEHGVIKFALGWTPLAYLDACRANGWEGVVWHHPDGRMAKLKVRDLKI